MPKKTEATPAAPAAEAKKPAPAEAKKPAAAKAEKAQPPAEVVEKKAAQPKNQPKQQGEARANQPVAPVQSKDVPRSPPVTTSQGGEKRTFTLSDDPVEAEIQKRLNAIEDEITAHRAEVDKIRNTIDSKIQQKNQLKDEQKVLFAQSDEIGTAAPFQKRRDEYVVQIKDLRRHRQIKMDELKKLKQQLGSPDDKQYLKNLEAEIKSLEALQASGDVSKLSEEKKLIAEIGKLQANKKLYKSYTDLAEAIKNDDSSISNIETEMAKIKEESDAFWAKKNVVKGQLDDSKNKVNNTSNEIEKEKNARQAIQDKINALRDTKATIAAELKEFRDKKNKEKQAEFERVRQQRQAEAQKRNEEKKQKELKRQQEEREAGLFAEEITSCASLISSLESLVISKTEGQEGGEEGANGAEGEEEKKKARKKPAKADAEKELKHSIDIHLHFEFISILPPTKSTDVEKTISEIKEKKEYYQKKSDEYRAKRQTTTKHNGEGENNENGEPTPANN